MYRNPTEEIIHSFQSTYTPIHLVTYLPSQTIHPTTHKLLSIQSYLFTHPFTYYIYLLSNLMLNQEDPTTVNLGYTARPCLKNKTIYSPFYPSINESIHKFCLLLCTQFINQLFYKPFIINPPHPPANSSIIHPLIYQLKCIYPFINL